METRRAILNGIIIKIGTTILPKKGGREVAVESMTLMTGTGTEIGREVREERGTGIRIEKERERRGAEEANFV